MKTDQRVWDRDFSILVDRLSQTEFEISEESLMHRAGAACTQFLKSQFSDDSSFFVLVGPGNNGGDGLVCARELHLSGRKVAVLFVGEKDQKISPACARERLRAQEDGVPFVAPQDTWKIDSNTVIVDAIFGIGFKGPIKSCLALDTLNRIKTFNFGSVVSVDIPSGMDCNAEVLDFVGLPSDHCLTFGGKKPCHIVSPLREFCGTVHTASIGFAEGAVANASDSPVKLEVVSEENWQHPADFLSADAHKFDRGHLLVIGGSPGKSGAPVLSAMAALRAGAGWVTLATPSPVPNAPFEIVQEDFYRDEVLNIRAIESFLSARKVRSILIGPGMMKQQISGEFAKVLAAFSRQGGRICLDAAATSDLTGTFHLNPLKYGSAWATPHPGEWIKAHSLRFNLSEVTRQNWKKLEESIGVKILYKSSTPVFLGDSFYRVSLGGSRSLSKAGMGDVFAGILATFLLFDTNHCMERALQFFHLGMSRALITVDEHALTATDLISALALRSQGPLP